MPMTSTVRKVANGWRASRPSEPSSAWAWRSNRIETPLRSDMRHRGEAALFDVNAAHAKAVEQVNVVGRHQDRDADRIESLEQVHHLEREVRVEVACRLVGDEHRGLRDHRAGDADALLLSCRELEGE